MKWDFLFTYAVLSRGRQYYKDGRVQGLTHEGDDYDAWVEGTQDYQVSVSLRGKKMPEMTCTCPYGAEDKHRCKHMAAVLFAIEAEKEQENAAKNPPAAIQIKKQEDDNLQVYPFPKNSLLPAGENPVYRYFDLAAITENQTFYRNSYDEARQLIAAHQMRLGHFETGYEGRLDLRSMVAVVTGLLKINDVEWKVNISFNRDRILQAHCMVPGCACAYDAVSAGNRYGKNNWGKNKQLLCTHILGTLLLTQEVLEKQNPGDATDRSAHKMLSEYRRQRLERSTEKNLPMKTASVVLEPRLAMEYDGLLLSFRAGVDKLYVVKNLTDLVEAARKKKVFEISPKTKIDFAVHRFSAESEGYFELLKDIVRSELSRSNYSRLSDYTHGDTGEEIKGDIPLYGKRIDNFFAIAQGRYFEINDKVTAMGKRRIRLREADPQIHLTISAEEKNGVFQGINVEGKLPELIQGEDYAYCLTQKHLNRISPDTRLRLEPLFGMADYANDLHFTIGRKNLSEFYYRVLPELSECAAIEEEDPELIHTWLPPEATFCFYLDADGQNVTCRAESSYRDQSFSLLDWLRRKDNSSAKRDPQREKEVLKEVQKILPSVDLEKDYLHCSNDSDSIYNLLESGISHLMEYGEVQTTDRFRRLRIRKNTRISVGVSIESELMDLNILSPELSQDELLDILYQYQKKKKYYRLKNGDFLDLEQESLTELASMLETLQVSPKEFVKGKMHLPLYRALYLDKMLEESSDIYADRDTAFRELVKGYHTVQDADFEVPESLRNIMRKYQIYGYRWLRTLETNHFGGILADDMGLGKTLQVISVLLANQERQNKTAGVKEETESVTCSASHEAAEQLTPEEGIAIRKDMPRDTSLVICPASLVYNWLEEIARFAPSLKTLVVAGSQPEREELLKEWKKYDVLITSYDLLKRDIDQYEDKNFAYQIIDEAQYIKNHTTAAAKAVKLIRSRTRYALTGTPIENRLSELWSIFEYLMPGFLYEYETFRREMETPITKFQDAESIRQLKRMVSPFILRRLKADVLKDLPPKMEEVRYTHLEGKQKELYDGQVIHMQQLLRSQSNEEFSKNKFEILAELMRIRQICCDPSLLVDHYEGESMKRQACMDMVRSAIEGEHKMLIFSQFTSMLELLEQDLNAEGISYYKIIGKTPKEERIELVRSFNEDTTPVFLISLKAGGTGLNLTGADIVIHYDPWWNIAVQNQATDRAHRIGQTRIVSVYKLIAKDTIEEKILKMQEAKRDLADEILSGELGGISKLTREELLALFE